MKKRRHSSGSSGNEGSSDENAKATTSKRKAVNIYSLVKDPSEKELKYRRKFIREETDILKHKILCTICRKDLRAYIIEGRDIFCHPLLKVIICKDCVRFYGDGEFSVDDDGSDKYCRWCGQGGVLYCCTECVCAFCKTCVKRNLGRSYVLDMEDENWKCLICDLEPLWDLRAICAGAQRYAKSMKRTLKLKYKNNLMKLQKSKEVPKPRSLRLLSRSSSDSSEDEKERKKKLKKKKHRRSRSLSDSEKSSEDEKKSNKIKLEDEDDTRSDSSSYKQNLDSKHRLKLSELKRKLKKKLKSGSDFSISSIKIDSHSKENVDNSFQWISKHCSKLSDVGDLFCFRLQQLRKKVDKKSLKDPKKVKKVVGYIQKLSDATRDNLSCLDNYLKIYYEEWESSLNQSNINQNQKDSINKLEVESEAFCNTILDSIDNNNSDLKVKVTDDHRNENTDYYNMQIFKEDTVCIPGENSIDLFAEPDIFAPGAESNKEDLENESTLIIKKNKEFSTNKDQEEEIDSEKCALEIDNCEEEIALQNKPASECEYETVEEDKNDVRKSRKRNKSREFDENELYKNKKGNKKNLAAKKEKGKTSEDLKSDQSKDSDSVDDKNEIVDLNFKEVEIDDKSENEGSKEIEESENCGDGMEFENVLGENETEVAENKTYQKNDKDLEEGSGDMTNKANKAKVALLSLLSSSNESDNDDDDGNCGVDKSDINDNDHKNLKKEKGLQNKCIFNGKSSQGTKAMVERKRNISTSSYESNSDKIDFSIKRKVKRKRMPNLTTDSVQAKDDECIADDKLKNCFVDVKKMTNELFEKYCVSEDREERNNRDSEDTEKYIDSLVNLANLNRAKQYSSDEYERDENCKPGPKSKTRKKKKEPEKKETLLDFLDKSGENVEISVDDNENLEHDKTPLEVEEDCMDKRILEIDQEFITKQNNLAQMCLMGDFSSDDDTDGDNEASDNDEDKAKEKKKTAKKKDVKKNIKNEKDEEKTKLSCNEINISSSEEQENTTKDKKRKSWRNNKLLKGKLSDTDTSDEERKWKKEKEKKSSEDEGKIKKKSPRKRRILLSDDSKSCEELSSDSKSSTKSSDSSIKQVSSKKKGKKRKKGSSDSDSDVVVIKKPNRKRIKNRSSNDSDSSNDDQTPKSNENTPSGKGRKNIRKVMKDESVTEATRRAAKEEEERKKRILEKQNLYNEMFNIKDLNVEVCDKLVLDFDCETKKEIISVHSDLVSKLKPHQVKGVKFMWDACFESVERIKKSSGSGCILAHCMGLGKTFQVVTLVHTLLTHKETKVRTVLVVCPLSTCLNWVNEFNMWLKNLDDEINVYELSKYKQNYMRAYQLKEWQDTGGVMVIGYEMFRLLSNASKKVRKKQIETFQSSLKDPGPDLVICDEGHLLKNEDTAISKAMREIKTLRRVVLTGTPLQNNLREYHCMVQFVKPNLLGKRSEFMNRFVNPIYNGQFEDSTLHDVKIMKRRAHVLHKMLEGSVQRFDYSVLTPFLPPKYEFVISVRLSELQIELYRYYLNNLSRAQQRTIGLFQDYQQLQRVWTHPRSLLYHAEKEERKAEKKWDSESEGSLKDFVVDDDSSSSSSSSESSDSDVQSISSGDNGGNKKSKKTKPKRITRSTKPEEIEEIKKEEPTEDNSANNKPWWNEFMKEGDEMENIKYSGKLELLFWILDQCGKIGDKVLIFSQSLYSLDLIEYFLQKIDSETQDNETDNSMVGKFKDSWSLGLDYFRLDGSISAENRHLWCKQFNSGSNYRARLFLISTRAGGLGINLFAANRVIIFDASWNPSHDVQSIFRVYRFGQTKPCYIYRFLAYGTMEAKIYERQISKLSLACRVVDEQQIERHYNMSDLQELYNFDPEPKPDRPTPILPKDRLLADMLTEHEKWIETYLEHDSLLENIQEEELNEEERKAAWEEYENEKKGLFAKPEFGANLGQFPMQQGIPNMNFNTAPINIAVITDMLRRKNPTISDEMLQTEIRNVMKNIFDYQNKQRQQQWQMQQGMQQGMQFGAGSTYPRVVYPASMYSTPNTFSQNPYAQYMRGQLTNQFRGSSPYVINQRTVGPRFSRPSMQEDPLRLDNEPSTSSGRSSPKIVEIID